MELSTTVASHHPWILRFVLIMNTRDEFAIVYSKADSYDDSTILVHRLTSSKLSKNYSSC